MCPPQQVLGFRRVFGNGGNTDGDGQGHRVAIDVEQMVFHRFANALALLFHGLLVTGQAHHAERVVTQAGQGNARARMFPQKGGQIAQQQVGAGDATLAIPLEGVIDIAAEKTRLEKAQGASIKERDALGKRLENPAFVEKAKPEAVAKAREDHAAHAAEAERLAAALARLG